MRTLVASAVPCEAQARQELRAYLFLINEIVSQLLDEPLDAFVLNAFDQPIGCSTIRDLVKSYVVILKPSSYAVRLKVQWINDRIDFEIGTDEVFVPIKATTENAIMLVTAIEEFNLAWQISLIELTVE